MATLIGQQRYHQVDTTIGLDEPLWSTQNPLFNKAGALGKADINTLWQLLYTLPRDHTVFKPTPINELADHAGDWVLVEGTLMSYEVKSSPRNDQLTIQNWEVQGRGGKLRAVQFDRNYQHASQAWRNAQRQEWQQHYGHGCIVKGKVKVRTYGYSYTHYDISLTDPEITMAQAGQGISEELTPIYSDTKVLSAEVLQQCVQVGLGILDQLLTSGEYMDPLPMLIVERHDLVASKTALENIHFPEDEDALNAAKERLIYEDFFYLQLALLYRKSLYQQAEVLISPAIIRPGLVEMLIEGLPYDLTRAQQRVMNEIFRDMESGRRMTRLVQGDVGSGKTVVAASAIARVVEYGQQAALMVPTEVLAEQHYTKLHEWLFQQGLNVALLTGSTKAKARRAILTDLNNGTLDVVVGTHALIQDDVVFRNLGLVVIDEQHRFGVEQRTQLQQKGNSPHMLSMTATPIPRTLALTLHGDLDVSQIDELPPGRTPIQTVVYRDNDTNRRNVEQFCQSELQEGRQIYVILPLVEKNEKLNLKAATEEFERLQQVFPDFKVGLLHGKLKAKDKSAILSGFASGAIQVLVSTTVVEVGVDVPNATVMIIEHAERFGLAQLHQLRGRVGRGQYESFCLLINSSTSDEAYGRLALMEQHTDGLILAEYDLQDRGSGELMGTEQHGEQRFMMADLARDLKWLERARSDAQGLVDDPDTLAPQEWELLIEECRRRGYDLFGEKGD